MQPRTDGGWKLTETIRSRLAVAGLRGLARIYRERPVPLSVVFALARAAGSKNDSLSDPWVARRARVNRPAEAWAMHPGAVQYVRSELARAVPSAIVEFGSGESTVWIASLLRDLHRDNEDAVVISIEQDAGAAAATSARLDEAGLGSIARVIVSPLTRRRVWDQELDTYAITREEVGELLGPVKAGFVLIDGPSGDPGARFGTLPLVLDHMETGARFFMDDALRLGELRAGSNWGRSGRVEIDGVHLVGRGILSGRVRPTAR